MHGSQRASLNDLGRQRSVRNAKESDRVWHKNPDKDRRMQWNAVTPIDHDVATGLEACVDAARDTLDASSMWCQKRFSVLYHPEGTDIKTVDLDRITK
jgi:hypothetical protein